MNYLTEDTKIYETHITFDSCSADRFPVLQ